jgi:hypothetical protein
MSTVTKLDPTYREARVRRRTVVAEVFRLHQRLPKAEQRTEAFRLWRRLNDIRRCSGIHGRRKDVLFTEILQASPLFAKT